MTVHDIPAAGKGRREPVIEPGMTTDHSWAEDPRPTA